MVRPRRRSLVQRATSGQAAQAGPKRASRMRRCRRSGAVSPAGQVTLPASRSMTKSDLLKRPSGAVGGWTLTRSVAPAPSWTDSSSP